MRGREEQKRIQYSVTCPCGGTVSFDARAMQRPLPCRSCQGTLNVAWGRDAMNTESIPVVVRHVPGEGHTARVEGPKKPTMKTQVLPQAKFFDCPCGERNVLMGKGPGATVSCCHCDRVHLLEEKAPVAEEPIAMNQPVPFVAKAAPPQAATKQPVPFVAPPARPAPVHAEARPQNGAKAAPPLAATKQPVPFVAPPARPPQNSAKPAPPPPPRAVEPPAKPAAPPPAPARQLRLGEILCKCGEILPPRTSKTGREFECKVCGRKGHVVPGQDAKGLPVIETVFTYEPAAAAMYKPPPPVAPPPKAAGAAAQWTCPCGTPIPAHAAMAGKISACPACGREIKLEKRHAPHSTMTMLKPVFADAKAVEFQELATAACPCGADLPVSEDLAGQTVSCEACSRSLEVVAKNGHVRLRER